MGILRRLCDSRPTSSAVVHLRVPAHASRTGGHATRQARRAEPEVRTTRTYHELHLRQGVSPRQLSLACALAGRVWEAGG